MWVSDRLVEAVDACVDLLTSLFPMVDEEFSLSQRYYDSEKYSFH